MTRVQTVIFSHIVTKLIKDNSDVCCICLPVLKSRYWSVMGLISQCCSLKEPLKPITVVILKAQF